MNSPKTKNNLPVIPSKLKNAPNPSNAAKFLDFIKSDLARNIYNKYGFVPHFV
jgi:ABC-type molybdate transport system substrate-binding protein